MNSGIAYKIPLLKNMAKDFGRSPVDPRVCFQMHYLFFTRPEISSFRELERELKEPKHQAWRNFVGVPNIDKVPVHSCLAKFRAKVSAELFYAILFDLIAQALKLEDFLLPMLTGITVNDLCYIDLIEYDWRKRGKLPIVIYTTMDVFQECNNKRSRGASCFCST